MPAVTPPRPEASLAEARALAHPLRLRIIRLLYERSLTNRELARALGEHPATVLHHVRTLLRAGFIVADPERRGPRGTVEKPYRSTGRSWTLAIDDEHALADVSRAAFEAFVAELREAQPTADLHTSRLAVNLTADERRDLDDRLAGLLDEYARRPPDAEGENWAVFVATHRRAPLPTDDLQGPSSIVHVTRTPDAVDISDCAADDPVAVLLVQAQWAELSARYGEHDPEPASLRYPGAFAAPTGAFVMLSIAGEAAGCGGVCRYDDADATAELKAIYVLPLHRGHGYSRLVVQALETRAVALGYRAARLETGDAQPEAIALYTALGYTQIERYGVYRDSPRSVCFERALGPVR
jgi:GNAT superfamily N-acetyltransferase/DNA-binding transcriptional ArsR family regulator